MKLKDITIKDFTKMNKFIEQWQKDKNDNKFEQNLVNLFNLNNLPIQETSSIINKLVESLNNPITNDLSIVNYNFKNYNLVNFDKIKVGRFLDADNYVNQPETITNFMAAVYDDGSQYEGTTNNKEIFEEMSCIYFIYAKNKFMDYKLELITRFKYLYREIDEDERERQLNGNFSIGGGEEEFQNEFGWYSMLYTFSKEQYMSIRDVVENVYADEFLTFMNFYKRKVELDNERIKNSFKH
jgi:hypothetical protein